MTEEEWEDGIDPQGMLSCLREKPSNRKLRLFAWACCRRYWEFYQDEDENEKVIDVAEKFADNRASDSDLALAAEAGPPIANRDAWDTPAG